MPYHYSCNGIIVGAHGVGKTSILQRYTAGNLFFHFEVENEIYQITMSIVTADKPNLKNVTFALVVFNLDELASLTDAETWVDKIGNKTNNMVDIVLVGNKADLLGQQSVSHVMGKFRAEQWDVGYSEVSAKTNFRIRSTMLNMLLNLKLRSKSRRLDGFKLGPLHPKFTKAKNCECCLIV